MKKDWRISRLSGVPTVEVSLLIGNQEHIVAFKVNEETYKLLEEVQLKGNTPLESTPKSLRELTIDEPLGV